MAITAPGALTYTPPNRSTQPPTVFSSNANDTVTQIKTFSTEMVTAVGQLNTDIGDVNTNAADIIASGTAAVAAANFQGNWADLTGAFTVGYSVKHDGLLWIANTAIADVTASEPGVSGDWDQIGGTVRETRTANIQIVAIDYGKIIDYTSGTFSQTFAPVANLGEGWAITLANNGTGIITLDPDSAETINGETTIQLLPNQVVLVTGSGTALFATFLNNGIRFVREARTSNTELAVTDNNKTIDYTSGTFSQTFGAAASLGADWSITLYNSGTGVVTLDPNASETIGGAATVDLHPDKIMIVTCDGSNLFYIEFVSRSTDNEVFVHTGNGFGSTNTVIRRFTTALRNVGTAITYADSAANGGSFTINEDGLYAIRYQDFGDSGDRQTGISLNSAQLTTAAASINVADRLAYFSITNQAMGSVTVRLSDGDVIRAHGDAFANASESALETMFVITKVGV